MPGPSTMGFLEAIQKARVSPWQGGTGGFRKGGQVKHRTHADTENLVLPPASPGSPPRPAPKSPLGTPVIPHRMGKYPS